MRTPRTPLALALLALAATVPARGQSGRVPLAGQDVFLSGGNVAWVNFARDIGPGTTNLAAFETMFADVRASGGNAMRLWLHTDGTNTPAWSGTDVTGPGVGAADDLRAILDLAHEYRVGVMLCLWSFDMLQSGKTAEQWARNRAILTDSSKTGTYLRNGLTPLVQAVADHPAVLAWEVFNEPEGMTTEFGWTPQRVTMADVQRFVNRVAGTIHRVAPGAKVTNGTWSFLALSDTPLGKTAEAATDADVAALRAAFAGRRADLAPAEARAYLDALATAANQNYYRDDRLVAAGGDPLGTLDYYTVHYYEWGGTRLSPFHHPVSYWALDKPVVVAEFYLYDTQDGNANATHGIPYAALYPNLYNGGYAGALAWQWVDYFTSRNPERNNWPRAVEGMRTLAAAYPDAVRLTRMAPWVDFRATPARIEAGGRATLAWDTRGAASVTINRAAADTAGTRTVTPTATALYRLDSRNAAGVVTTRTVTVEVGPAENADRAAGRPAVASATAAGSPGAVTDGDPATAWTSLATGTSWIYVDLGAAYDLRAVVFEWGGTPPVEGVGVDVSYDARTWRAALTPVLGKTAARTDSLVFPPTVLMPARYVRMNGSIPPPGGHVLSSLRVYGARSPQQPPVAELTAPADSAVVTADAGLDLAVTASDPEGALRRVVFYADGDSVGVATAAPYRYRWPSVPAGPHRVWAVAVDADGLRAATQTVTLSAVAGLFAARFEAEAATFDGQVARETATAGASGGAYLTMRDTGAITWASVTVPEAGPYALSFGYNLVFDTPKSQNLIVNGAALGEVVFAGPTNTWQATGRTVDLVAGANTVALQKSWGWMAFDYLDVTATRASAAEGTTRPGALRLDAPQPSPTHGAARVRFAILEAGAVRLDVFDGLGRRVATLADGAFPPGEHTATFDGAALAPGLYLCRLTTAAGTATRTVVVAR